MAAFRVRRRREEAHALEVHDAELAQRAGSALFAADARVRAADDELGFAEAELGSAATVQSSQTLHATRRALSDAFRSHRRNHEADPGSADEVRARYVRIVQSCEWIEAVLDEQASALAQRVDRVRRAPEVVARVQADAARLRPRIAQARQTVERLTARYARDALAPVAANPGEAERLLAFAEHGVVVAERRRTSGRLEETSLALEASAHALHRAARLLDAVDGFELEALRAESTLAAIVDEARRDLAAALGAPRPRSVAGAVAELQAALADIPAAGVDTDPIAHLNRVREAHAALDAATAATAAAAAARERAVRADPAAHRVPRAHDARHVHELHDAIEHADRRLDVARDAIAAHRGRIGAYALTRLAESEHIRSDLAHSLGSPTATITVTSPDHREQVIAMARRAGWLASEAVLLARRDIRELRSQVQ